MDARGRDQRDRRGQHVAGAAHHARQRVGQPHRSRAAEHDVGVAQRVVQGIAATAQQPVDRLSEHENERSEQRAHGRRNRERVHHQPPRPRRVARAERARDGGRHAAAHRAGRGHLQEHQEREHEREPGERLGAEAADEVGVADRDHRLEQHQQHARRREPQHRGQDRRGEQPLGARVHVERAIV